MDGIRFAYKNKRNVDTEIIPNKPQYVTIEPRSSKVFRYFLSKDGIDVDETTLQQDTIEPDVVEVKVRPTRDVFISRIIDFDNIDTAPRKVFPVNFEGKGDLFLDVLYTNKLDEGIKIKVSTISEGLDTFETEHTVTDKPDEFVKIVNVTIKRENIEATYVHRRSGRLKMSPLTITYEELADIWADRITSFEHVDDSLSVVAPRKALNKAGWLINSIDRSIYREENKRRIQITKQELGSFLSTYATPLEILNLLHTKNFKESQHALVKKTAENLQDCNRSCSLVPVDTKTLVDTRK